MDCRVKPGNDGILRIKDFDDRISSRETTQKKRRKINVVISLLVTIIDKPRDKD